VGSSASLQGGGRCFTVLLMHELTRRGAALAALATLVVFAACSAPGASQPDPARVLRDAGHAMATLKSVKADTRFGPGVTLQGLTLTTASSSVQLPDQSDTVFKVKQGDFLVEVRVVTSGGHVYLRLPFSRFTELGPEQAAEIPNLARLFDAQSGLSAVLAAAKNPTYQGTEKVGDADSDKVAATYTAAQIGQLMGITPAGDVRATVWAARSDHMVRRVVLSGPLLQAGKDVQVQVDLHDFNRPVTITPPTVAPTAPASPASPSSPTATPAG
jgi:LppX_LprAFG lipoprotein